MLSRCLTGLLGLLAVGLLAVTGPEVRAEDHKHSEIVDNCAKACTDCLRACESCARHCAGLVAEGKKEHLTTLGTCADCGDICGTAAKIVARRGPLMFTVCEGCAKMCDECGKECEKFPMDEHMKECAKSCRDCAKACREMIKHAEHIKDGSK
jgi:hypothetical protein